MHILKILSKFANETKKNFESFSAAAEKALLEYYWPGNIRELHKCLKRTLRNADNNVITADCIDFGGFSFPQ